jgi:hypothetical protein
VYTAEWQLVASRRRVNQDYDPSCHAQCRFGLPTRS